MRYAGYLVLAATAVALPGELRSQGPVRVSVASFYESYSFDQGLVFDRISEFTVPVGINVRLGSRAAVALSTGYLSVDLESANQQQLPDQSISGALDTQLRLSYDAVPGRLILFLNGALPTGTETVNNSELSIIGAITSDLIGFTASTVGTGGNLGGGFAGAIPLGRFAFGLGGTFTNQFDFTPVNGDPELAPGAEFRIRTGFEGPLARRMYVRVAGIFARRGKDEVGGLTQNGVGNRLIGYVSVNRGIGRSTITLYGFDVFRADPQIEATATGSALLPRGNLFAFGGRIDLGVSGRTTVSPRFELRTSSQEPFSGGGLERLGDSFRAGVNLRYRTSQRTAVVLQGGAVTGDVVQGGEDVGFDGYRISLHLELGS